MGWKKIHDDPTLEYNMADETMTILLEKDEDGFYSVSIADHATQCIMLLGACYDYEGGRKFAEDLYYAIKKHYAFTDTNFLD